MGRSDTVLWRPDPRAISDSNIARFQHASEESTGRTFGGYDDLYQWSLDQPEEFWSVLWGHLDVLSSHPWTQAIAPASPMRETRFFDGARLNFAENLLRCRDDKVAVIFRSTAARSSVGRSG